MPIKLKYIYPLRFILISPHYHRWYHADDKEAYDKNFAGTFPFWDILFGTYHHPEELPDAYGLSKKERSEYSNTLIKTLYYPIYKLFRKHHKN